MEPAVQPSAEDVREELNAIRAHKRFVRTDRLCRFLQFVVEQRLKGNHVNEQIIGINVFGRQPGYDTGSDTIVRTEAVELRKRLQDYYNDNPEARVRISIVKGSYNPVFTWLYQEPGNTNAPLPIVFPDIPEVVAPGPSHLDGQPHESPLETTEKEALIAPEPVRLPKRRRSRARRKIAVAAICALVTVIVAASLLWRARRITPLTGNHAIILAEFVNTTGEPIFDGTLKQALAIQLEQSPFLNVLSDAKIAATLKLMNRQSGERLTQQVAREICERTNSEALIAGSIARVGNPYLIALKAINCQTGDTLASADTEAPNRDRVLGQLERVGNQLRRKLGESLASIQHFNKPLEEATTSSLDALKAFTHAKNEEAASDRIPYLERAIELDPNFADAYGMLGTIYVNLAQISLGQANLRKAFELRHRLTQREQFRIEAAYYALVRGELDRGIQTYKEWAQIYPADEGPHINLGAFYITLGQYENCISEMLQAIRINPDNWTDYGNIMACYFAVDRLDEAQAISEQAHARNADFDLQLGRYLLAFLENDKSGMQQQLALAIGKPDLESTLLSAQSDTEAYYGRLRKARAFSARAVDSAERWNKSEAAALYHVNAALREVELGNTALSREEVRQAMALSSGRDIEVISALALARAGDSSQSLKILDKLTGQFPLDFLLQRYWIPSIRAALDLNTAHPQRAIGILQTTSPYDLGAPYPFAMGTMYPVYIRGLAYLRAKQAQSAAAQFANVLQHRGIVQNFPLGALAHVQLARALAMAGDTSGARNEYQDFLALWKDADPDIPILKSAKLEYAKLKCR